MLCTLVSIATATWKLNLQCIGDMNLIEPDNRLITEAAVIRPQSVFAHQWTDVWMTHPRVVAFSSSLSSV